MLNKYEKEITEGLAKFGWRENPFTLKILPHLFVGYEQQVRELVHKLRDGHKFILITGATGSGKTMLLKLIANDLANEYEIFYLAKPPNEDSLVDIFLKRFKPNTLQRILGFNITLHDLSAYVNKKLGGRRMILLVDEGHEAEKATLEWMRTLTDQIHGMTLVIAALPVFERDLATKLETLKSRLTTRIELTSLSEDETKLLIQKRIESSGGEGVKPFTTTCLKEIYEHTGGFPREILKLCDQLIYKAIKNGEERIEKVDIVERVVIPVRDFLQDLPYKQRKIIKILAEGNMFPSEIVDQMGTKGYKTREHAIRSVNNILRRLMEDGYVIRDKRGKGYIYSLDVKIKNMLVEA